MTTNREQAGHVQCGGVRIRPSEPGDLPLLREMLFEAAWWRPDQPRPDLDEGLSRPDLAKLLADWGRAGDTAVVAERDDGEAAGAAWYRFWSPEEHSYGFVSREIPELAIGVRAAHRRRGVGAALLAALLDAATHQRVARLSLSVEVENPARRLYERLGFRQVERVGGAITMIADAAGRRGPAAGS